MRIKVFLIALGALAAFFVVFAGCGGSSDSNSGNGGGNGNGTTGLLTLSVSDAPVDGAKNVFIAFTGVEIKPAAGTSIEINFPAMREIDLLALRNGISEPLLEEVVMEAGQYEWIRLKVFTDESDPSACRIVLNDDSVHNLTIPSGNQSGLKLNRPFEIPVEGEVAFILDFDLRKSITRNAKGYKLRPTIRIAEVYVVGAIAGNIIPPVGSACEEGAVYVFEGAGVTPDDVDEISPDPIASAIPFTDTVSGECRYRVSFLLPGEYTVAATWDAAADDPLTDDPGIVFNPVADAAVVSGQTTTVDLIPAPGTIAGSITLIEGNICESGAVYLFEGAGMTPDDVDGIYPDPIAVAIPFTDGVSGLCLYSMPSLLPGEYTVAATPDAAADDPLVDDAGIIFFPVDAIVTSGETTTVDLIQLP